MGDVADIIIAIFTSEHFPCTNIRLGWPAVKNSCLDADLNTGPSHKPARHCATVPPAPIYDTTSSRFKTCYKYITISVYCFSSIPMCGVTCMCSHCYLIC